jgi:ribosome-associated protein
LKRLSPLELARIAGRIALSKKGFDVRVLNLKGLSSVCDYFVIVSGEADIHVKAIAESINDGLAEKSERPYHEEGLEEGNWVLLDYVDVVIHVFRERTRQFYALEKLWGDAAVEELAETTAAR